MRNNIVELGCITLLIVLVFVGDNYIRLKDENARLRSEDQAGSGATQPANVVQTPAANAEPEVATTDSVPPKIDNLCLTSIQLHKNEERICINVGAWNGYQDQINSIPITGKIIGNIKSITVEGKHISWDANNEIYQRINLFVYGGLNKYKVVAEDTNGNVSTGFVEMTSELTNNNLNVNVE